MSVPVPLRRESKLQLEVDAYKMVSYTLEITSNPKTFDIRYSSLTERIVDVALDIGMGIWEANKLNLKDETERTKRKLHNAIEKGLSPEVETRQLLDGDGL